MQILNALHIPVPERLTFAPRRLKRRPGALSEEWAQRYQDMRNRR